MPSQKRTRSQSSSSSSSSLSTHEDEVEKYHRNRQDMDKNNNSENNENNKNKNQNQNQNQNQKRFRFGLGNYLPAVAAANLDSLLPLKVNPFWGGSDDHGSGTAKAGADENENENANADADGTMFMFPVSWGSRVTGAANMDVDTRTDTQQTSGAGAERTNTSRVLPDTTGFTDSDIKSLLYTADDSLVDPIPGVPPFSGPYKPWFTTFLGNVKPYPAHPDTDPNESMSHVNCSYLTPWMGADGGRDPAVAEGRRAPSLVQLKQHALSLANLIWAVSSTAPNGTVISTAADFFGQSLGEGVAVGGGTGATDWMELVGTGAGYHSEVSRDHIPLLRVLNVVGREEMLERVVEHGAKGNKGKEKEKEKGSGWMGARGRGGEKQPCPLPSDGWATDADSNDLLAHANDLLQKVDLRYARHGGVLALLPPPGHAQRKQVEDTLLGQWMIYTTNLSMRVAQLEIEVENSRVVLAGEATAPWVLARSSFFGDGQGGEFGRPLVFPQDRYVLTGLSQGLWERLDERLRREERRKNGVERVMAKKVKGARTKEGRIDGGNEEVWTPPGVPLKPSVWTDVTARVYRTHGRETMFICLGFGDESNPDTRLTAQLGKMPLVSVMPHPEVALELQEEEERERQEIEQKKQEKLMQLLHEVGNVKGELQSTAAERDEAMTLFKELCSLHSQDLTTARELRDTLCGENAALKAQVQKLQKSVDGSKDHGQRPNIDAKEMKRLEAEVEKLKKALATAQPVREKLDQIREEEEDNDPSERERTSSLSPSKMARGTSQRRGGRKKGTS